MSTDDLALQAMLRVVDSRAAQEGISRDRWMCREMLRKNGHLVSDNGVWLTLDGTRRGVPSIESYVSIQLMGGPDGNRIVQLLPIGVAVGELAVLCVLDDGPVLPADMETRARQVAEPWKPELRMTAAEYREGLAGATRDASVIVKGENESEAYHLSAAGRTRLEELKADLLSSPENSR
jgi:hypothetical protein